MTTLENDDIAGEDLLDLHTIVLRGNNGRVVKLRNEAAIAPGITTSTAKSGEHVRVVWGGGPTVGVPGYMGSDGLPHVQTYTSKEQLYRADGETVLLEVPVTTKNAIQEMAASLRLSTSDFLEAVARLPAGSWMDLMRAVRDRVEEDFPSVMIERQGCAGRDVIQTEHEGQKVAARDIGSERLSALRHSLYTTYGLTPKELKRSPRTSPRPSRTRDG